jgi:hypothetical protein
MLLSSADQPNVFFYQNHASDWHSQTKYDKIHQYHIAARIWAYLTCDSKAFWHCSLYSIDCQNNRKRNDDAYDNQTRAYSRPEIHRGPCLFYVGLVIFILIILPTIMFSLFASLVFSMKLPTWLLPAEDIPSLAERYNIIFWVEFRRFVWWYKIKSLFGFIMCIYAHDSTI